ncbi:type III secretion system export apparatus subunit SctU [Mailhella sp.]|uniref:type III secretion system export apparatus subunit SctU n=1 Tax=Mailhella sp. TaxID=1981029 RepID=UPI004062BC69
MSEKTEQPTPKRLREAREKGDVCKSQDIAPALTVLGLGLYLIANGENIFKTVSQMVAVPMTFATLPFEEAMAKALPLVIDASIVLVAPVVGIVMGLAFIGIISQTGVLFAFKAAMPKLENLDPKKWFQKVFSMKNLFELVKNMVKVSVLGFVVWTVLKQYLPVLFEMPKRGIGAMWTVLGSAAGDLLLKSAAAFAVIAALDYLYQRYKYNQNHMMSKDEVKREYKESEGDPHIKSKRKQLQKEMLAQSPLGDVRKAKVLVTNPTHFAVALDYEKGRTELPVILVKGQGERALRMMEIAREAGIPVMRNVPLARALYHNGNENEFIPKDLITPVAEVLRWVRSLENA